MTILLGVWACCARGLFLVWLARFGLNRGRLYPRRSYRHGISNVAVDSPFRPGAAWFVKQTTIHVTKCWRPSLCNYHINITRNEGGFSSRVFEALQKNCCWDLLNRRTCVLYYPDCAAGMRSSRTMPKLCNSSLRSVERSTPR